MKIEGGCLCGKVRYSADAEPTFVGICHCKNCQKGTGTAFSVVVALPTPASWVKPASEIFCDSAQPWVQLGGERRRSTKIRHYRPTKLLANAPAHPARSG